jgi:hypothetical protein
MATTKKTKIICRLNWEIPMEMTNQTKSFTIQGVWLRAGEVAFVESLKRSFDDLNCINRN